MFNKQYTAIMQYGIYCWEWQVKKYSSHIYYDYRTQSTGKKEKEETEYKHTHTHKLLSAKRLNNKINVRAVQQREYREYTVRDCMKNSA